MGYYSKRSAFVLLCVLLASLSAYGLDNSRDLENRRIEYIQSFLDAKGIAYEERSLFVSQGGFGRSIHVVYPAENTDAGNIQEQFVLALPLSSTNDTEDIERFDIKAALFTAERFKQNVPHINVRIAFLGDEYSSLPKDVPSTRNIGLADLFSIYDTPENVILCYLDIPFAPRALEIHHGSSGVAAPLNILPPLTNVFEERDVPYSFYVKYNELYKLRLIQSPMPLETINSSGFTGIFIDGNAAVSNPLFAELCGEAFAAYIGSIETSSGNHDTHYFFINAFSKTFYFNEMFTVLTFLIIGLISLIFLFVYSLTRRYILVIQWRIFFKRSWIVLLHFFILTGSLIISGLIYVLIGSIINTPNLHADYISILMRFFIALCFYNLFVPIFYRLWIPRKAQFYGNAAVVLVVIGTVIAAFMDITFVPIFLWSFVFTLLGAFLNNPWMVLLCTITVPLQLGGAFVNIIYSDSQALANLIASNNIFITLFIACITLPEILMANRIVLLFRRNRSDRDLKTRTIQQLIIIGTAVVLLIGLGIFMASQVQPLPFRKTITELEDSPENVLHADITSSAYLDRRVLSLSMHALGNPAKFNINISSIHQNTPLVIYDAPVPFERFNEDNMIAFRLGERPDNPFEMEIVLPAELQCTIVLEAVYSSWDSGIDPKKPENTEDYMAAYRLSLPEDTQRKRP